MVVAGSAGGRIAAGVGANLIGQHSLDRNQDATIYVGNLDPQVSEELVWELFSQAGPVVFVYLPKDRINNKHQGYGFVEYQSEIDANYSIKVLNMIKVWGKPIRVNKASTDKNSQEVGANLFIGNLDPEVDEKLLYDTFCAFGVIVSTPKIMRDPTTGISRGFGFISYDCFEASDAAVEAMNGQYLCNRPVSVSYAFKKDTRGERHGTPAERLLAAQQRAQQSQQQQQRPHLMFSSGDGAEPQPVDINQQIAQAEGPKPGLLAGPQIDLRAPENPLPPPVPLAQAVPNMPQLPPHGMVPYPYPVPYGAPSPWRPLVTGPDGQLYPQPMHYAPPPVYPYAYQQPPIQLPPHVAPPSGAPRGEPPPPRPPPMQIRPGMPDQYATQMYPRGPSTDPARPAPPPRGLAPTYQQQYMGAPAAPWQPPSGQVSQQPPPAPPSGAPAVPPPVVSGAPPGAPAIPPPAITGTPPGAPPVLPPAVGSAPPGAPPIPSAGGAPGPPGAPGAPLGNPPGPPQGGPPGAPQLPQPDFGGAMNPPGVPGQPPGPGGLPPPPAPGGLPPPPAPGAQPWPQGGQPGQPVNQ